jgi:hypothetical protein
MLSRQKYIQINHQYPSLVSSKFKFGIENLKRCKSPGSNQILAEPIQAGVVHYVLVSTNLFILFGIWKSCHSSGNNLVVPIYKEWWWKWLQLLCRDITVTNCIRNFKSTLLLRLIAYIDEIIGYRQHVCRCTISIADHIFWNDSGTVHQLFVDFKKACDSGETYCTTFSLLWLFLSLLCPLACYDPELTAETVNPFKHSRKSPWRWVRSLVKYNTENWGRTSILWAGLEPTIPALEWSNI